MSRNLTTLLWKNAPRPVGRFVSLLLLQLLLQFYLLTPAGFAESIADDQSPIDLASFSFVEIDDSERLDIVRMLESAVRDNFQRIVTWSGTYDGFQCSYVAMQAPPGEPPQVHVKRRDPIPLPDESWAARLLKSEPRLANKGGLLARQVNIQFAVDIPHGDLFVAFDAYGDTCFVSLDTRQAFRYEELALPKLRHVVTTEHWLSYNPTAYRATGIEAQRAAQQSIATGSRRFPESAERFFDYATIVNPARMFGVHGVPFFKSLMLTADGLEHGKEVFAHLEEARSGTRRLIRLREEVKSNRDAPPNLITETVFDSDAGNNPVWYEQTDGKGLGTERFRWHYVQAEGIYIPSVYHHQKYDVRTGDLEFEREIKLLDSKVNGQLDRARFSLAALGLPDRDRVDDEIEGRIFEYRNGALVEPGEKTIDASLRSVAIGKDKEPEDDDEKSGLSTGRYLSLIGNFAFLVAILAVCWFVARRRPRGQR